MKLFNCFNNEEFTVNLTKRSQLGMYVNCSLPFVKALYGIREKGSLSGISISFRLSTTRCIAIQNSSSESAPSLFRSDKFLQDNDKTILTL
jgi:hypothetical protein